MFFYRLRPKRLKILNVIPLRKVLVINCFSGMFRYTRHFKLAAREVFQRIFRSGAQYEIKLMINSELNLNN